MKIVGAPKAQQGLSHYAVKKECDCYLKPSTTNEATEYSWSNHEQIRRTRTLGHTCHLLVRHCGFALEPRDCHRGPQEAQVLGRAQWRSWFEGERSDRGPPRVSDGACGGSDRSGHGEACKN